MFTGFQVQLCIRSWWKPEITYINTRLPVNNYILTVIHITQIEKYGIYSILLNIEFPEIKRLVLLTKIFRSGNPEKILVTSFYDPCENL